MPDLVELAEAAIGAAKEGEEAEAFAQESRRFEVKSRNRAVEALSASESRGVGVRVVVGGRLGYAWAADPTPEETAGLLDAAREGAAHATADEANALPDPKPIEDLPELFRPDQAALGSEPKVALVKDLEQAAISAHPAVRKVEDAAYADAVSRVAVVSTTGVSAEYSRTDCWCAVSALAERDGETQSGFSFRVARSLGDLPWEEVASEAAIRAARLLGARKPPTDRVAVVFDPWAAAAFLGVLAAGLSAEEVQKGRSLFAGKVGERVASEAFTLVDDGRLLEGPAAAPFDDEGVPTGRTALIEAGVLRGYLYNTFAARRDGVSSTGNASRHSYRGVSGVSPSNLFVEPGEEGPEAILARADGAVYVQDVTGVHSGANPVSGEFSVGATGLRVREGGFGEPLREMTIASTLGDVLGNVEAVGADLRFFSAIGSPSVLVGEMTVAGR